MSSLNHNGRIHRTAPAPRPRSLWPLLVFGLIGLNMSIVGITIYYATSDGAAASEPDYYKKAVAFQTTIDQRAASAALGWSCHAELRASTINGAAELAATITDRDGKAVDGLSVNAELFANIRAGDRQQFELRPLDVSSQSYGAFVRIDRPGLWHLRLKASRGSDVFVVESDIPAHESLVRTGTQPSSQSKEPG